MFRPDLFGKLSHWSTGTGPLVNWHRQMIAWVAQSREGSTGPSAVQSRSSIFIALHHSMKLVHIAGNHLICVLAVVELGGFAL